MRVILMFLLGLTLVSCTKVDSSEIIEDPKLECLRVGGEWFSFSNGCVDSCDFERSKGNIDCTQAFTMGCDCDYFKCWNGKTCEAN